MVDHVCVYPRDTCSALPLPRPSVRGSQQPYSNRSERRMTLGPEIHHPLLLFNKENQHIVVITSQILPEASRTGNNLLEADNKVMSESIMGEGEGREWLQRAPDDSNQPSQSLSHERDHSCPWQTCDTTGITVPWRRTPSRVVVLKWK